MVQAPMLSSPLKQTSEVDWIHPLKSYIRSSYGDEPEKYSEECSTLNRLRQDMRGAGADSASGRDLLYRYYGQLELLDLRFPVDENHIKISFTWFDAFTHKPTSQYSLAFEKASVIFNISAVLSCHAAAQNRSEDSGLKTAYHSFQASAGMFTYINENFLHAPSTDLSRDTVRTLISTMLAQAQEIFLEKQVRDGKKSALLAKLASQAAFLYSQAKEGAEAESMKEVFDSSWAKMNHIKMLHMTATAEYNQALADNETSHAGSAIARLQLAEKASKQAYSLAKAFTSTPAASSNLGSVTASNLQASTKRLMETVQEKLSTSIKDNDFIYHQTVPAEASLVPVTKMPAAKAIPVSELYQGQDIQRIIGPDIFQKIVPMSVTESASMYDEEKAKLVRSEAEKCEQANSEMAASLDYLKLPSSLDVLKGGSDHDLVTDPEFARWCRELADHQPFSRAFEQLQKDKSVVVESLNKSTKQLDMEESVCEKMRSKYGAEWSQQPSSRLTSTLRGDIKSYRDTVDEASKSDAQLLSTARTYESDFDEMRKAGEKDDADALYQQAMVKTGAGLKSKAAGPDGVTLLDEDYSEGGPSVADQIAKVEDLLKRLNLVKKERMQILKDLREKVQSDDISHVLLLNKKSIGNQETQLFTAELEKFRSHQNRLISTVHKQSTMLKELTKVYGDLLQDKRVRGDQQKYESVSRSKTTVLNKYRKIASAHGDLIQGLMGAQSFYSEMKESVESLGKNVDSFVNNRRSEGAQLLNQIEQNKSTSASGQAAVEHDRLQQLMARMSMDPAKSPPTSEGPPPISPPLNYDTRPPATSSLPQTNADPRFTIPPREEPAPVNINGYSHPLHRESQTSPPQSSSVFSQGAAAPLNSGYNPMAYPERTASRSQHHKSQSIASPPAPGSQPNQPPFHQSPGQGYFPPQQSHTPQPFTQHLPQHQQSPPSASSQMQPLNFTSPPPQMPYPQFAFPPQQHPTYQVPQAYSYPYSAAPAPAPGPYNMPQGYIPPPPPPGPPGGGSTTQYPAHSGPWASGPGGYASYNRPAPATKPSNEPQQAQANDDPWAGLSAWK